MSEVTLIIVHGDNMHSLTAHWREIKTLLNTHPLPGVQSEADAGYIVVDFNKRVIISAQHAFALQAITGFEVMQL